MQYIVGFNGPPRVGKDTIANCLRSMIDVECTIPTFTDHLARPMREMAMSLCGLDPKDFQSYTDEKDDPRKLLKRAVNGSWESLRQLMIATSEDFIKPRYGQDFWGRKLVADHKWLEQGLPGILIVPDIGFPVEVGVFDSMFPKTKTLIVQVDRPGTTWELDSRVPCEGQRNTCHVFNDSRVVDAAEFVLNHMTKFLGWDLSCGN